MAGTRYIAPAPAECTAAFASGWSAPAPAECTAVFDRDLRWQIARHHSDTESATYGVAAIRNAREFLLPDGFLSQELGPALSPASATSAVFNVGNQFTTLTRVTARMTVPGTPTVESSAVTQTVVILGDDTAVFGLTTIDWLNFHVSPAGIYEDGIQPYVWPRTKITARFFDDHEAPPPSRVTTRYTIPGVPVVDRFFAPSTQHSATYGYDQSAFGAAKLIFDQFIRPGVIALPAFPLPRVEQMLREVFPKSWRSDQYSVAAAVINKNRRVLAGGTSFMAFQHVGPGDVLQVYLRNQFVSLAGRGLNTFQGPSQRISHFLRYLDLTGRSINTLGFGAHWASRSPRYLEADTRFDFPPTIVSSHLVGGLRFLEPFGWDSQRFGTRIVPETQIANLAGWRSDAVEHPTVELWRRYVRPGGFEVRHREQRYGNPYVWNLLQFVHHAVANEDPADHLNPPVPSDRAVLVHRNRTVVASGWRSDRHGYTLVENAARAVLPFGAPSPEPTPFVRYGFVTHWEQIAAPDGLESLIIGRWHIVHNAARVVGPATTDAPGGFGLHLLRNLNRTYRNISAGDAAILGYPFVADAIRELTFESRYGISPPYNAGHEVKLYTRWIIGASAGDAPAPGVPWLRIHWNIIRAGWGMYYAPDWVGQPGLRNVTPELRGRGTLHEEFGRPSVRNEWESYPIGGTDMARFGRHRIQDRRQWVYPFSVPLPPFMPGPVATRIGGRPDNRIVVPAGIHPFEIPPPPSRPETWQVPAPTMNLLFVLAEGYDGLSFGDTWARANSIRVEPGIWDHYFADTNRVEHLHRVLDLDKAGIPRREGGESMTRYQPRVSPHTIYAVMDQPPQADANHPLPANQRHHYVDYDPTSLGRGRLTGIGANLSVSHRHRPIYPRGFAGPDENTIPRENPPEPTVDLKRRYVTTRGARSDLMGWVIIPGTQILDLLRAGVDQAAFGQAKVAPPPYVGPRYITPRGWQLHAWGMSTVDFFHRFRTPNGFDALRMGGPVERDTPYMWQGLRVGEHIPTQISGGDLTQFGEKTWVSLWIRTLATEGDDYASVGNYDPQNFAVRMRVRRIEQPPPPRITVRAGDIRPIYGAGPRVRNRLHFIRPDGDADQYRKNHAEFGHATVSPP